MNIRGFNSMSSNVPNILIIVINPLDLLLPSTWCLDLHSKYNVFNLRLCQRSNINIIDFSIVCKNEIFEINFYFDPFIWS